MKFILGIYFKKRQKLLEKSQNFVIFIINL